MISDSLQLQFASLRDTEDNNNKIVSFKINYNKTYIKSCIARNCMITIKMFLNVKKLKITDMKKTDIPLFHKKTEFQTA